MRALGSLVVVAAACGACAAVLGVSDVTYGDGGAGDGGDGPGAEGGTVSFAYNPLNDPGKWSAVHIREFAFPPGHWQGAAFDGRYVTFFPLTTAYDVVRYDTHGRFETEISWDRSSVDLLDTETGLQLAGGILQGGRIYVVSANSGPSPDLLYSRGTAPDPGSWTSFDLKDTGAVHTYSITDGRYLYLTPQTDVGGASGKVVQLDPATMGSLVFDASATLTTRVKGFGGSAFDGRFVYFVPYADDGGGPSGVLARFDTASADGFTSPNAWDWVDLTTLGLPGAPSYLQSSTFDGRYLYLWRSGPGNPSSATVARFDTHAKLQAASSWSAVTLATAGGQPIVFFDGSTFDGRYVYAIADGQNATRAIVRYDTTAGFAESSFESAPFPGITNASNPPMTVGGMTFDGRYVYVVPNDGDTFIRFDAKEPAGLPAVDGGSFY